MTIYDLVAAYSLRNRRRKPVDSRSEDRYYAEYASPVLPLALRVNAPVMAVLVLAIVGAIAI